MACTMGTLVSSPPPFSDVTDSEEGKKEGEAPPLRLVRARVPTLTQPLSQVKKKECFCLANEDGVWGWVCGPGWKGRELVQEAMTT